MKANPTATAGETQRDQRNAAVREASSTFDARFKMRGVASSKAFDSVLAPRHAKEACWSNSVAAYVASVGSSLIN
jgi:hypothetical protein